MPEGSIEEKAWSYIRSFEKGFSVKIKYERLLIETLRQILLANYRVARIVITIQEDKTTTITPEGDFLPTYARERESIREAFGF